MSDELVFSGGGSVAVGSGAMIDARERLRDAHHELLHLRSVLGVTGSRMPPGSLLAANAPISAFQAQRTLADAQTPTAVAAAEAAALVVSLDAAMTGYGLAERAAELAVKALAARLGHSLGWLGPLAGIVLGAAAPWAAAAVAGGVVAAGGPEELLRVLRTWIGEHNELLNNPSTVTLVKIVVDSIDDVVSGAVHVPAPVATLAGFLGLSSVGTTATAIVLGAGLAGGFTERGTTVTRTRTATTSTLPSTFRDRLDRIPTASEENGAQVRIDRYSIPDEPDVYEVYISGTQEWSAWDTESPFDLGSNVRGVAEMPNGSLEAVRKAMDRAGIDDTSRVVFVGHSQGGLLAHELAASGSYRTEAVIAAGPPASSARLPADVPELILAHDSDLVTALGGSYTNDEAIVVGRDPYAGERMPPGDPFQAHARAVYTETAGLLDAHGTERTDGVLDTVNGLIEGATRVESSYYRAVRSP